MCFISCNTWTAAPLYSGFVVRGTRGKGLCCHGSVSGAASSGSRKEGGGCSYVNVPTTPFPEHRANSSSTRSSPLLLTPAFLSLSIVSPGSSPTLSRWAILHIFHSVTHWTPACSHTTLASWTESRNWCHWIRGLHHLVVNALLPHAATAAVGGEEGKESPDQALQYILIIDKPHQFPQGCVDPIKT